MKILLTGRDGQVGWELERALPALGEVIATDRAGLDIGDAGAIARLVDQIKPGLIVNAAAYTAVDKAETEKEAAMRVNGIAPGILAEEAKRLGALLVHYSTDYVFDGEKQAPYVEEDVPHPLGVYGASKLEGEKRVRAPGCRHLILRTSWVYGPRGRNFFLTMKGAKQPLRVVDDQRGVPTSSAFLAEHTVALLKKDAGGIVHLVPSGETTWYGFARQILGDKAAITPIRSSEYQTAARRPANSILDNSKARRMLGRDLPDWRALLSNVRKSA
jgi:dTDP-4-dehydrorhamnose reductase